MTSHERWGLIRRRVRRSGLKSTTGMGPIGISGSCGVSTWMLVFKPFFGGEGVWMLALESDLDGERGA